MLGSFPADQDSATKFRNAVTGREIRDEPVNQ